MRNSYNDNRQGFRGIWQRMAGSFMDKYGECNIIANIDKEAMIRNRYNRIPYPALNTKREMDTCVCLRGGGGLKPVLHCSNLSLSSAVVHIEVVRVKDRYSSMNQNSEHHWDETRWVLNSKPTLKRWSNRSPTFEPRLMRLRVQSCWITVQGNCSEYQLESDIGAFANQC